MALEQFKEFNFKPKTLDLITLCNSIVESYAGQGYDMTLRQLYYQLVSKEVIENSERSYKRLGETVANARLAGLMNWSGIVDRTRNLRGLSHWNNPDEIIASAAASFRIDKWERQKFRIELWVEKDALTGVFSRVCNELDIPYFSCRGYTSLSEMYYAAKRLYRYTEFNKTPLILHFGDHDPSGLDMTRDIRERMEMFNYGFQIEVKRLALNMEQIDKYDPPPNPAKVTDSRYDAYLQSYGAESWELDALNPEILSNLVRDAVENVRDAKLWEEALEEEREKKESLQLITDGFNDILPYLKTPVCPIHKTRELVTTVREESGTEAGYCRKCEFIFDLSSPE